MEIWNWLRKTSIWHISIHVEHGGAGAGDEPTWTRDTEMGLQRTSAVCPGRYVYVASETAKGNFGNSVPIRYPTMVWMANNSFLHFLFVWNESTRFWILIERTHRLECITPLLVKLDVQGLNASSLKRIGLIATEMAAAKWLTAQGCSATGLVNCRMRAADLDVMFRARLLKEVLPRSTVILTF